jgi:hypothetical protein
MFKKGFLKEAKMKKVILLVSVAFLLAFILSVYAVTPQTNFRVVNTSAVGSALGPATKLTDTDLVELANLGTAENPRVFPPLSSLNLKVEEFGTEYTPGISIPSGALTFSGSITEEEAMEFVSLPNAEGAGKYDLVIVKPDGTVTKVDNEVVINYEERTIKTYDPLAVEEGDVVLVFVKDFEETFFGKDKRRPIIIEHDDPGDNQPGQPGGPIN